MTVIDAQVHAYERDHPGRPWATRVHGGAPEVTGDDHVAAMDRAGVDGALLVSPFVLYGTDTSFAEETRAAHPDRFAIIAPFDPAVPGSGEAVSAWAGVPGAVGIRLMVGLDTGFRVSDDFRADDPGVREIVRAAEREGLPICVFCWGKPAIVGDLARLYPNASFVIDHLGLPQPFDPPPPAEPFGGLEEVLALAQRPNVTIKVSGVCTLSHRPYPFDDLWKPFGRVFDAFGVDRCMWGTDWTRTVNIVSYPDAVGAFRELPGLSPHERDALMGGSLSRVFQWSPG